MYIHLLNDSFGEDKAGGKALSLSYMLRKGFPVPNGFVINTLAFHQFAGNMETDNVFRLELENALQSINAKQYMVRSSAVGEDSDDASFAGQLDSFICSNDPEDLLKHIKKCWESRFKDNVKKYETLTGKHLQGMGVVIQKLIQPDIAGVLFSRHPENETKLLIEYVEGHGEKLVSGAVTPESVSVCHQTNDAPSQFKNLINDAKAIEKSYGFPVDIEWAIADGQHYFVQARPITTNANSTLQYWSNTNVNENYPEAISPLLYSIARDAYYNYFKNLSGLFMVPEKEIRLLESAYCNVIGIFGARMYYNMSSIHQILSASPFSDLLLKSFDNFVGYENNGNKQSEKSSGSKLKFVMEMFRFQLKLKNTVVEFEQQADAYSEEASAAISFEELKRCFHGFIEIRMHSWYKASLADFFAMLYHGMLGKFCRRFYGEQSEGIHNKLIQAIPGLISSEPILSLYDIKCQIRLHADFYDYFKNNGPEKVLARIQTDHTLHNIAHRIQNHISNWGFRCSGELMLTHSTYMDEPHKFIELLQQYDKLPDSNPSLLMEAKHKERLESITAFKKDIFKKRGLNFPLAIVESRILSLLINLACKGIASRERVRLKQALLYYRFKQVLQKSGKEFKKRHFIEHAEDLLFLRYKEIAEHFSSSEMLAESTFETIKYRKDNFEKVKSLVYPDDFSSHIGYYPKPNEVKTVKNESSEQGNGLKGMPVCGGKVRARVRVLESVMEAHKLEKGDILVTRQTDPGWVLVFPLISGLIVERGGMLSHGAIVSREFGIPAIVGVHEASSKIPDGALVILDADTGFIEIINE